MTRMCSRRHSGRQARHCTPVLALTQVCDAGTMGSTAAELGREKGRRGPMKPSRKPTALAVRYGSEEAGLESEELAERMRQAGHTEWTASVVRNVWSGRRAVRTDEVAALHEILDIPLDWYVYGPGGRDRPGPGGAGYMAWCSPASTLQGGRSRRDKSLPVPSPAA